MPSYISISVTAESLVWTSLIYGCIGKPWLSRAVCAMDNATEHLVLPRFLGSSNESAKRVPGVRDHAQARITRRLLGDVPPCAEA